MSFIPITQAEMNELKIQMPPSWLKESQVSKALSRVQNYLEWDLRRVSLVFYSNSNAFEKAHGLGKGVLAFSQLSQNLIGMGPGVNALNFEATLSHELVHFILSQKYKKAIPKWIEEGAANFIAGNIKLDCTLIHNDLKQHPEFELQSLKHPFVVQIREPKLHYQLSLAAIKMIQSKCSLHDLLQLSVGKSFETYLKTFCEISDLNVEFKQWVKTRCR